MPTYDYECTKCGKVFEIVQPITEAPRRRLRKTDPRPCKCGAPISRRIGSGGGIIFKGSGFYTTDYRSDGYKKSASADSGESAKPKDTKDTGTKTEKTPAKKEPKPKSDD